jgi:hypothetical protein
MNVKNPFNFKFTLLFYFLTSLLRIAGATLSYFPIGFSPMESISLFSTRLIRRRWLAYLLPLLIILSTDSVINFFYTHQFSPFYHGFYWQYLSYFLVTLLGQYLLRGSLAPPWSPQLLVTPPLKREPPLKNQEFPLKRELLPGFTAGAAGNPPLAPRGSLAPPWNPQLFVTPPLKREPLLKNQLSTMRIIFASFTSATLFFIISNFGVFVGGTLYPINMQGFIHCYVMALPFYAKDVGANLFFSLIINAIFSYKKHRHPDRSQGISSRTHRAYSRRSLGYARDDRPV